MTDTKPACPDCGSDHTTPYAGAVHYCPVCQTTFTVPKEKP